MLLEVEHMTRMFQNIQRTILSAFHIFLKLEPYKFSFASHNPQDNTLQFIFLFQLITFVVSKNVTVWSDCLTKETSFSDINLQNTSGQKLYTMAVTEWPHGKHHFDP